jgi:D-alanyl-D-alanine carboxypeptidase
MTLTVEEAILALVTKSANDAAAALGEFLGGGSEYRFAQMMTLRARALGMTRTTFRNASGLPDLDQVSTARDMALLGRRLLQDFPRQYAYFSTPHFVFRGRTHWNHNRLLQEYDGTDGIKTGYVNDSGFNLVASTQREGVRLVAAVFGGRTGRERDRHMMAILDQGFGQMGVAPRDAVAVASARRPAPVFLASARAATPPAARAGVARVVMATAAPAARRPGATRAAAPARPVVLSRAAAASVARGPAPAARPAAARPPLLRLVTTRAAVGRIEQGDTGGRSAARSTAAAAAAAKPQPGKAAPARAAAAKPSAAAGGGRRPS